MEVFPNDNILIYSDNMIYIFDSSCVKLKSFNINCRIIIDVKIISNTLLLICIVKDDSGYINIFDLNSEINPIDEYLSFNSINKCLLLSNDKFITTSGKFRDDDYSNFVLYKINNRKIDKIFNTNFNKLKSKFISKDDVVIKNIYELPNGNLFVHSSIGNYQCMSLINSEGKIIKERKFEFNELHIILCIENNIRLIDNHKIYILFILIPLLLYKLLSKN